MKKGINKLKDKFKKVRIRKSLKVMVALMTMLSTFVFAFVYPMENIEAQTLISSKQSTNGSPYAFYTFSVTPSSRTSTSVLLTLTCSGHLQSSGSYLGTGSGYGLVAGVYVGGAWRTWTLKSESTKWQGTTSHSASTSVTISGLSNTTTSLTGIQVRVLRTNTSYTPSRLTATSVGNISVPANASYTVSYDANGGTGAPSSQTKWNGSSLTLSSTKPTRPGYNFVGWNTSSTATTASYAPGASYTSNAALKLYAIWSKVITLRYDANGGTGEPTDQTATIYNATTSKTFVVSTTTPTKVGFTFKGWSTSAESTAVAYTGSSEITLSDDATLYAVWLSDTCDPFLNITN